MSLFPCYRHYYSMNVMVEHMLPRYEAFVRNFFLKRIHDTHAAADCTQDVLCAAVQNLHTLKNPEAVRSWLKTIASRRLIQWYRESGRMAENGCTEFVDSAESKLAGPEALLEREETAKHISAAVNGLSQGYRDVVYLYYFAGYPVSMIAEALGIGESAVKKRLERSRSMLKSTLKEEMKHMMDITEHVPMEEAGDLSGCNLNAGLEHAAVLGQECFIEEMIADGIDVNSADVKGQTMLHCAAACGLTDAVRLLVRAGADISVCDKRGRTAAECAEEAGHHAIAGLIRPKE